MNPKILTFQLLIILFFCSYSSFPLASASDDIIPLVPVPKNVTTKEGTVQFNAATEIQFEDASLQPIAGILSRAIYAQTGIALEPRKVIQANAGIILKLDGALENEAYQIDIDQNVVVVGHDYRSIAWAAATLVQLVHHQQNKIEFSRVTIDDAPDVEFRSVMLDVARRWHPAQTLKDTIDLLWLHKIKYLHLHLSDNQSFTFPSQKLPKLPTPNRSYSPDEMKAIVRYADERGIIIIPEIDVPGHASWVNKMPETFGTTDPATGKSRSVGIVNMANEKSYQALDLLFAELAETFASSPYIHLGCDEVGAGGLMNLPEYQPYCQRHSLTEAAAGKAHELYLHFIQRADQLVRKHGKRSIIWNDFGGQSTPNASIPKDVIVMAWAGSPDRSAGRGYSIVVAAPYPLYMVPPQHNAPEDHQIYNWDYNVYRRRDQRPIVLPEESVIGSELCFWEQRYNEVLPILFPRVPAFAERLWQTDSDATFEDFHVRRRHTSDVAQNVIYPVRLQASGLTDAQSIDFVDRLEVSLTSPVPGNVVYALHKDWEEYENTEFEPYTGPFELSETMTVSARLVDHSGAPIGGVTQQRYQKIVPAYKYRLLGPTPITGWDSMPDFSKLDVLRHGVTGLMTVDRATQINRSMFAGLEPEGHVDVRRHDLYNPLTLEFKGQIKIPTSGKFHFQLRANNGMAQLDIGGQTIVATQVAGRNYLVAGELQTGIYPLTIKYFNRRTWNDLNILVKQPGDEKYKPFETLVVPLTKWVDKNELDSVSAVAKFIDPSIANNKNLATGKPVSVSGGTEGNNLPSNAVDGVTDNASGWHANPFPQSLQVDLQDLKSVNRIKLHTYHDGVRYYQYTIEVSQDGKKWKRVVDMSKNTDRSTSKGDEHNFPPIKARFVKVNMLANSANPGVHINELMVYEAK